MREIPFLNLKSQYEEIKSDIDKAIKTTIESSSYISGDQVKLFEKNFSEWNGSQHCVGCANGTDAIEIALEALGIGDGDHVIVPAMTWISTAEAVVRVGAIPIFVDINPKSYCIDIDLVRESITEKTKAVIAVHLYGHPADVEALVALCNSNELYLIEDCAQAHGGMINGSKKVGNTGHIGTYSFFPGKNLGAYGDAGCIVTNDIRLANICRQIGNHGQIKKHEHIRIGRNSRLDGIQAAILTAKLQHIDSWLNRRQAVAEGYKNRLSKSLITLPELEENIFHAFHLFVIIAKHRDKLRGYMNENGVNVSVHYPKILPDMSVFAPYLNKQVSNKFPIATLIANNGLSLPISDQITQAEVEHVCETINRFYKSL